MSNTNPVNESRSVPGQSVTHFDNINVGSPQIAGSATLAEGGRDLIAGGADIWEKEGAEDMASSIEAGAASEVAFSRHGGICRSDVSNVFCKPGPAYRIPVGAGPGHEARRKETRLLIVATSSGWLFLDRGARQHGPSPLHRHSQFNR